MRSKNAAVVRHEPLARLEAEPVQLFFFQADNQVLFHSAALVIHFFLTEVDRPRAMGHFGYKLRGSQNVLLTMQSRLAAEIWKNQQQRIAKMTVIVGMFRARRGSLIVTCSTRLNWVWLVPCGIPTGDAMYTTPPISSKRASVG